MLPDLKSKRKLSNFNRLSIRLPKVYSCRFNVDGWIKHFLNHCYCAARILIYIFYVQLLCTTGSLFKVLWLYPAYPIELCHLSGFNHIISFVVMHVTENLLWLSNYMFQKKIELPCHWIFNKTQSCPVILELRFPQPIDIAVNFSIESLFHIYIKQGITMLSGYVWDNLSR